MHALLGLLASTIRRSTLSACRRYVTHPGPSVLAVALAIFARCSHPSQYIVPKRSSCPSQKRLIHTTARQFVMAFLEDDIRTSYDSWSFYSARSSSTPALHEAVRWNRVNVLDALLRAPGLNLEERDENGHTALMLALSSCHFRCYEKLVAAGAHRFPSTKDSHLNVLCTVAGGDVLSVQKLEDEGGLNLSNEPKVCKDILAAAAGLGRVDVLRHLLSTKHFLHSLRTNYVVLSSYAEYGFDYDKFASRTHRHPATTCAVEGGHLECFDILASAGADLSENNKQGRGLVEIAALHGHAVILRRLLEFPSLKASIISSQRDAYSCAVRGGSIECLEILRDAGAVIDDFVSQGSHQTGLHLAAVYDRPDMLKYLLGLPKLVEKIDSQDSRGNTALMNAVASGSASCFKILRSAGASVYITTKAKETLIHIACKLHRLDFLLSLLAHDPIRLQINALDNKGQTALMVATLGNSVASARMLLAAGANPNIPSRGCSPLHIAAELLDSGLLETLLESSLVNLDCRNIKGRTPIILATKAHRLKQFRLLVDAGADRTLSDTVRLLVLLIV
eukprot:m.472870 g.472870  ORF g.472870 m.472870 type:complete len:564 (-) comp57116_c0_seq14:482-2173(-)